MQKYTRWIKQQQITFDWHEHSNKKNEENPKYWKALKTQNGVSDKWLEKNEGCVDNIINKRNYKRDIIYKSKCKLNSKPGWKALRWVRDFFIWKKTFSYIKKE